MMARNDTRLHRLEAMVAGLLAWQNVAEKELVRLQERVGSTEVHLHSAQEEWRARVADLEGLRNEYAALVDRIETEELWDTLEYLKERAGGPELANPCDTCVFKGEDCATCRLGPEPAAAPTQAACPACGAVGEGAVWVVPTYAADWEHRMMDVLECRACHHRWTRSKQAAQPAPQQPRSCKTCRHCPNRGEPCSRDVDECLGRGGMPFPYRLWQPRSGGG